MAWLKGQQPAAARVRSIFESAERGENRLFMNIVNLGEVFYLTVKTVKSKGVAAAEIVLDDLRSRITTITATDELVLEAALLKAKYAIAYADGFAVATAIWRKIPLVTGDPEIGALRKKEHALKLKWIGSD